jgi:hypothetical protein
VRLFTPVDRLGAWISARAFAPVIASSGTRFPTDFRPRRIARRRGARGSVFSLPALLPQRGVLLLLRVNELLAGIAMLATGTPIAPALLLIRPALWLGSLLARRPAVAAIVVSNPGGLR